MMKWILRLLSGISIAVIYFIIFSIFFDTPIEYELKKSTAKIEQEYEALSNRYDTLLTVLDNVAGRDSSVYKILFEAEPIMASDQSLPQEYDALDVMTNKELGERFDSSMSVLRQQVGMLNAKIVSREELMIGDPRRMVAIPAIQPVENHQLNLLTASFGNRIQPFFKTMTHHDGVDYSVPVGTAVFATADGYVQRTQTKGQTSGLSLTLDHGNGYTTTYSHLDKVVAPTGRKVSRGDIIAFSGNSGLSFAPHLHYAIKYRGVAIDPLNYFFMELNPEQGVRLRQIAEMGMQSFD